MLTFAMVTGLSRQDILALPAWTFIEHCRDVEEIVNKRRPRGRS